MAPLLDTILRANPAQRLSESVRAKTQPINKRAQLDDVKIGGIVFLVPSGTLYLLVLIAYLRKRLDIQQSRIQSRSDGRRYWFGWVLRRGNNFHRRRRDSNGEVY